MAARPVHRPAALVITAADGTGRAGVQAALGVLGDLDCVTVSAVTAILAPGPERSLAVWELPADAVAAQVASATAAVPVRAVVTGRLGPAATVAAVAAGIEALAGGVSVVVSAPARGWDGPAEAAAIAQVKERLLRTATLLVADPVDALGLVGVRVRTLAEQRVAVRRLHDLGPAWILLRGRGPEAVDLLTDGHEEHEIPRDPAITRAANSAEALAWEITARLAHGAVVQEAVAMTLAP